MPHQTHTIQSSDDEEDQVIASYDVYLTPQLPAVFPPPVHSSTVNPTSTTAQAPSPQAYHPTTLLQFPTRSRATPLTAANGNCPQSLRLKPHTGFLELDVPLNSRLRYNSRKAKKWAKALRDANANQNKIKQSGGEGSEKSAGFGMANGFTASGMTGARGPPRKGGLLDDGEDKMDVDSDDDGTDDDAEDAEVLHTQALGGKVKKRGDKDPYLFVGTFRDDKELHLTEVSGVAQLRAEFHHLDAESQMSRYPTNNANRGGGAAGGPTLDRDGKPRLLQTQPRRTGGTDRGGPGGEYSAVKELLQRVGEEPWSTLAWTDEESESSYAEFAKRMFLAGKSQTVDNTSDGEKKASMEDELQRRWTEEEYLDRVGGGVLERRKVWERSRRRGRKKTAGVTEARCAGKGKQRAVNGDAGHTPHDEEHDDEDSDTSELSDVDDDMSEPEGMI
ncbi:MAG: hypothetical protein Q9162_001130 [Coniocarpon cinnabarinum]